MEPGQNPDSNPKLRLSAHAPAEAGAYTGAHNTMSHNTIAHVYCFRLFSGTADEVIMNNSRLRIWLLLGVLGIGICGVGLLFAHAPYDSNLYSGLKWRMLGPF